MPRALELYLNHLDNQMKLKKPASFSEIVKTAKINGIRIIAIDSEASYSIGVHKEYSDLINSESLIKERVKTMNTLALERFLKHDDGNNYVMFVGEAHAPTIEKIKFPGVADFLGCPAVFIRDLNDKQRDEKIELGSQYKKEKYFINCDILYYRTPISKNFVEQQSAVHPLDNTSKYQILFIVLEKYSEYLDIEINPGTVNTPGSISAFKVIPALN